MKIHKDMLNNVRWIMGITLAAWAGGVYQGYLLARELQVSWGSARWMTALIVGGLGLLILAGFFALTWSPWRERLLDRVTRASQSLARLRFLHLPLMVLAAGIFPLVLLPAYPEPVGGLLTTFFWRAFQFWLAIVAGAAILHLRSPERGWWFSVGISALMYGAAYRIAVFLPEISTYPFTLYWSEGSRYYYASLFFSDQVYGVHANPTVLHPTRYLMQSLPFLVPGLPIWVHRLWQVILWVATNAIASGLVVWRVKRRGLEETSFFEKFGSWTPWLIGSWAFLFLFQGPVWYHLVIMIIIVLWGVDTSRFWKTLFVVLVATAWGGISRVNWIPFPAALAGMIYLLEREKGERPLWGYLFPPIVWGFLGSFAGILAQTGYVQWSGNRSDQFGSAFTSDMLWYRLFPSVTYPLGVLPGILLATLPVIWLGMRQLRERWGSLRPGQAIHPIRWLGVVGVLGVFFAGGLVVSAKIGGGSNLHNMDGYLALLLVAGVYAIFGIVKLEPGAWKKGALSPSKMPWLVAALAILVPIVFALDVGRSYDYDFIPKPGDVGDALAILRGEVQTATASGGEVLFISERHLLTFKSLDAPLVDDYEKVFLMEMAMANNPGYLGQFEQDLRTHRFALVVTVPVQGNIQDQEDEFGEENNAWVEHVNVPLMCYYQEKEYLKDVRVEILEPREGTACPDFNP